MKDIETITLTDENGIDAEFYILEQTTLQGANYLLVADNQNEEDAEAFLILKEEPDDSADELATFNIVEDDKELKLVAKIFSELLDIDLEV